MILWKLKVLSYMLLKDGGILESYGYRILSPLCHKAFSKLKRSLMGLHLKQLAERLGMLKA